MIWPQLFLLQHLKYTYHLHYLQIKIVIQIDYPQKYVPFTISHSSMISFQLLELVARFSRLQRALYMHFIDQTCVKTSLYSSYLQKINAQEQAKKRHNGIKGLKPYFNLQLNLHETNLSFQYLSNHLTWHCPTISEDLHRFARNLQHLLAKMFLLLFLQ